MVERLGRRANLSLLQSILIIVERLGRQANISLLQSILVMITTWQTNECIVAAINSCDNDVALC